ncbi:UDP-N-acetylmuramate dehydrogenase [Alkalilimnicola sp. S0819]|uniref:UDP-N-acetylmuramate dehydrogenase n=1 Tax=Alkalilimnicola sp. S0819 TaxID=2613922 RepID=UPI00126203C7|nr:UDP-N-acetylmuramate dehydrogenase [Alkalilimnicola sp. S0819]KAB7623857.1 UDP-N-acetylmuramate dehydrogenase [Alkalilimnicola sp. S0819]MPQ16735.1 UDP-N-acetylmuramate dehydrogenase [Alkalilimnicola sp. S0819]
MMAARRQQGELLEQVPLHRYTSWRVGGPAERFYRPVDLADLCAFLAELPADEPLTWLGLGSNLLVRDGGVRGTVIHTQGGLDRIEAMAGQRLRVEAGSACAKVAKFAAREGLAGAAFLAGIPGTFGGALAMNAGAFGGETWERVEAVQTVDRHGVLRERPRSDFQVAYREVCGPEGEWFVAGILALDAGSPARLAEEGRALLARRGGSQPIGKPSCGSVFRNPPADHAARLIEEAGLKGYRIGGALVSEKHANFILNEEGASAADIEALMGHVRDTVLIRFGVRLEPEVRIVGEPA